ncbi:MAG: glycosyl-4,4'-diaponeurosporenoate acyltransferase [Clostridiales bacterium]|nr:glycosyl-4,4'-diaponeurosporenoate acyltransferase [Clostridiales bacterium]
MPFVYCLIYLISISLIIYVIGRIYPRKWIKENSFPFKSFKFEKHGKIYDKLKIKKWKTKLPDFSLIMHKIISKIPKKRIENTQNANLKILIKETCIAEATHFFAMIFGFLCVKIWYKFGIIISTVFAALNVPFILIQRYNRPRLIRALNLATA